MLAADAPRRSLGDADGEPLEHDDVHDRVARRHERRVAAELAQPRRRGRRALRRDAFPREDERAHRLVYGGEVAVQELLGLVRLGRDPRTFAQLQHRLVRRRQIAAGAGHEESLLLAHLREAGIETILLRAGAPPLDARLKAIAQKHGVLEHVVELGSIGDQRLVELYNAADATLFPSHWEGFGWPAAEALACGTPTVVSDCAPLLETVGNAALAAPATDPAALAAAVRRVWDSPVLRDTLRQRGLERARQFSWRSTAERYLHVYRRIAGAVRQGPAYSSEPSRG